jgi:hypothetical protein
VTPNETGRARYSTTEAVGISPGLTGWGYGVGVAYDGPWMLVD